MLTNRSYRVVSAPLLLALASLAAPAGAAIYTGSLATDGAADGALIAYSGSPAWGTGTVLTWSVDTGFAPGLVRYSYTLTAANNPGAGISHMILELTGQPNPFTAADVSSTNVSMSTLEFGPWAANPGSAHLPSALANGVKFTPGNGAKSETLTIVTSRLPMWGDYYARGGQTNEVWNAGFGTASQEADSISAFFDPTDAPANGSIRDHVLVPNSHEVGVLFQIIKFHDLNGDGARTSDEPFLGEGWQFEVAGGNLSGPMVVTTDSNGMAQLGLSDGVSYLVTEVNLPAGWTQTTNGGNPIAFTADANNPTLYVGNIPEPTTLCVIGLGTAAFLVRRRRA